MADVNHRVDGARDRGQMLLVAAFGVAVMLVALALILNTSIYTENIATRGSDISGGKDAQRYRAVTEKSFEGTVQYVNEHNNTSADTNADYDELEIPARNAVWNYSNISGRNQARDSIVTDVSVKRQSEGTRVYQDGFGDMSNPNGERNWTVVNSTDGVREFTIDATSLEGKDPQDVSPNHDSPVLFVNFTDPDEVEWYALSLFEDSAGNGTVWIKFGDHTGYEARCKGEYGGDGTFRVNVTAGQIGGSDCRPLNRLRGVYSDPFHLVFNNTGSSDIDARFSMILNKSYASTTLASSGPPHKTRALYSMTIHMTYESKRLYYETDIRVAPGEPDG